VVVVPGEVLQGFVALHASEWGLAGFGLRSRSGGPHVW